MAKTTQKVTQKDRVLKAMSNGRSISPWYAINSLGNTRLAATIYSLKQDGHKIETVNVEGKNKFGDKIHYATYKLIKRAKGK